MTLNPQRRVDDDSNLDTDLGDGRTVRDAVNARFRRDDDALAEALALLGRDYRTEPGYVEPAGPQGLLPGEDR